MVARLTDESTEADVTVMTAQYRGGKGGAQRSHIEELKAGMETFLIKGSTETDDEGVSLLSVG